MADREIWVAGYPSFCGGADTEIHHQIIMWRAAGIKVFLVPLFWEPKKRELMTAGHDPAMRSRMDALGCFTRPYKPGVFADKVLVSFCNGNFLKGLPEICRTGRPAAVVWANCMTWCFDDEKSAHAAGLIDYHLFQSEHQYKKIVPTLKQLAPVNPIPYLPYYHMDQGEDGIRFDPHRPISYFGIGRVSRDDGNKFPADLWSTYNRIITPGPKKVYVLGFGPEAEKKCGPPWAVLDWATATPGSMPPRDIYAKIHALVHQTGGSGENLPRVMMEAWQSGAVLVCENNYGFKENVTNGVDGFLCDSSDEFAFRASQLAWDSGMRDRMAAAGYEKLKSTFANAELCMKGWDHFFAKMLGSTPKLREEYGRKSALLKKPGVGEPSVGGPLLHNQSSSRQPGDVGLEGGRGEPSGLQFSLGQIAGVGIEQNAQDFGLTFRDLGEPVVAKFLPAGQVR